MIIGISKEELIRLKEAMPDGHSKLFIHILIKKCTELDPWLPIDSKTPWNKDILLWERETQVVGYYSEEQERFTNEYDDTLFPTHYKLLPEDPK